MIVISPVQVKICCIQTPDEAHLALSFGAAAIGLVSEMPSGPGDLAEDRIRAIVEATPDAAGTFLLTAVTDPDRLIDKIRRCGVNTLQMWDPLPPDGYARLRTALPHLSLVQAIHVRDRSALAEAEDASRRADALVLDSGDPAIPYRWESPAGRTHDWSISREIVQAADCPVLLAGGLDASNVEAAVRRVRPYGVDVCTGVRTEGRLDKRKLAAFVEALLRASP